ncbi:putative nuclease HARBI1 isoform X1 [Ixodes scapularis]
MTVELLVLCALRFYAMGSFQGMVASDEHVARDQKTVSVAVRAVSVAIVRRLGVQRGWIHFPETPSERFDAEKGFRLLGRIPGVIGCVDGTMVSIVDPSKNDPTVTKAAYWCRKYFYALNVMVVSTLMLPLVTNFRQESQHLTKGTAVGHVEEIQDSAAIAVISEDASPTQNKTITSSELDIDPSLPAPQRRQLRDLLAEFSECFSTSSKVCDADCRIMCIDPRYPGSVHDSFVWQFSWLRNQLEQGQLPRDGRFLLGDSGYPLEPWLITPVPGNHATSTACGRFNKAHSSIRSLWSAASGC